MIARTSQPRAARLETIAPRRLESRIPSMLRSNAANTRVPAVYPAVDGAITDILFSSIMDNPPWHSFLQALERYLSCSSATVVLRMPDRGTPGVVISTTGTDWSLTSFHRQVYGHSFLTDLPANKVHFLRERYSEGELAKLEYYTQYLRVTGGHDIVCLNLLDAASGMVFRLRCTRTDEEPQFGDAERRLLEALIPRLQIAVALYARMTIQELGLTIHDELEEQLDIGSLMLDDSGAILHANRAAWRLLEANEGITIRAGRLCATSGTGQRLLSAALAKLRQRKAAGDPPEDIEIDIVDEETGGKQLQVLCRTLSGRAALEGKSVPSFLLLIRRLTQASESNLSTPKLVRLFGLTKAEANLTAKLASGESLCEAATSLGISKATARCHLSSVFGKTGCHRQAELVGLVLKTLNSFWPEQSEASASI